MKNNHTVNKKVYAEGNLQQEINDERDDSLIVAKNLLSIRKLIWRHRNIRV